MERAWIGGFKAVKQLLNPESYCFYDISMGSPLLGKLSLNLYKRNKDKWEKIDVKTNYETKKLSIDISFLNVIQLQLFEKEYGKYISIKAFDESKRCFNGLIKARSNRPLTNILVCDQCDVIDTLELQSINSIEDLDFGKFSSLKRWLVGIMSRSSSVRFLCKDPKQPINCVYRFVEYERLLKSITPDRGGYKACLLHDGINFTYLRDKYNNPDEEFVFKEFFVNLDLEGSREIESLYTQFYNDFTGNYYNDKRYYWLEDIVDEEDEWEDDFKVGLDTSTFLYPKHFLDIIKKDYLQKKKEKEIVWEKERERIRKEWLVQEQKKKEEEKRNRDYNLKNEYSRDTHVIYKDSHYYLHNLQLLGVKRVISNFFPTFDADYWAGVKAPLIGKTKEQLLREWERKGTESAEAGTKLHERIDAYYHHKEITTDDKDYVLFKQFAEAYKLTPYRSEWAIYDEDTNIVGVVDMLDYSNGEYILYDWKRSDKIVDGGQPIKENKFDEYGLKPIDKVPNTDYWHYALQLSFYRYILEKNYGISVKESRLVVLHPSLNLPVVLTTPYMIEEINKIVAVLKMN